MRGADTASHSGSPLRGRAEFLRLALDRSPMGLVVWDERMRVAEWSAGATRIFGYAAEEAIGRSFDFMIPEPDRMKVEAVVRALFAHDGGRHSRNHNTTRDGRVILCDWHNIELLDDSGSVIGIASLVEDASEKARGETAMREREELLGLLLRQDVAGIYFATVDDPVDWGEEVDKEAAISQVLSRQRLTVANDEFLRAYGQKREDAMGHYPGEDFDGDLPARRALYRRIFDEGAVHTETVDTRVDGTPLIVEGHFFALRDARGRIRGHAGIQRDVTRERRAQEEALRAREALAQEERLEGLGRLARHIAHDLNNALSPMLSGVELARRSIPEDGRAARELAEIARAIDRATELSRRLAHFARGEGGAATVVDLVRAVASWRDTRMPRRDGIVATFQLPAAPVKVAVNAEALAEVLGVLAENAMDAMPYGGPLLVTLAEADARSLPGAESLATARVAVLEVADSGHGMAQDLAENLFTPFYRSREGIGESGLGLALVRRFLLESGGVGHAESTPGRGTRVRLVIPIIGEAPAVEAVPAALGSMTIHLGETLLLAEDEEGVRHAAARVFHALGFKVIEAGDGDEALALARELGEPLHFLVTDLQMPGRDGLSLAREVARVSPDTAILIMSAFADERVSDGVLAELGALFLRKPYRVVDLVARLRELRRRTLGKRTRGRRG